MFADALNGVGEQQAMGRVIEPRTRAGRVRQGNVGQSALYERPPDGFFQTIRGRNVSMDILPNKMTTCGLISFHCASSQGRQFLFLR